LTVTLPCTILTAARRFASRRLFFTSSHAWPTMPQDFALVADWFDKQLAK